jgi:hypothetical protein
MILSRTTARGSLQLSYPSSFLKGLREAAACDY